MKNLKDFNNFSLESIELSEDASNYPPGAENDPNAPWNQRDVDYHRGESVPQSQLRYDLVESDFSEFAILKEKSSGKLYLVAFDSSDPDFRDFMEIPVDYIGRDEDGDPEYDYRYEDAEVDDDAILGYSTSLSKAGKAGKGLYAFESGDLAEVDEELAQSMLDDFKKWAADPNWSKGGKGEKYLKMADVLEKMLKEKE